MLVDGYEGEEEEDPDQCQHHDSALHASAVLSKPALIPANTPMAAQTAISTGQSRAMTHRRRAQGLMLDDFAVMA